MGKIDFKERFRRLAYAPTTKSGTPLFRKHPQCETGAFTEEQLADQDFKNESDGKFTSPKNIRAMFIGWNKSVIIHHRGFASVEKATNKDSQLNELRHGQKVAVGKVYDKVDNAKNPFKLSYIDLKIIKDKQKGNEVIALGIRNGQTDDGKPTYKYEVCEEVKKKPLSIFKSGNDAILNNVEEIYFDINGLMDINDIHNFNAELIIENLFGESEYKTKGGDGFRDRYPRLQRVGLVYGLNKWLEEGNGEEVIRELSKDKGIIGDKAFEGVGKEIIKAKKVISLNGAKNDFKLIKGIWWYDAFLESLRAEEKREEDIANYNNENKKEEDYKLLNDYFEKFWMKNGQKVFMKRTDYSVKMRKCQVGEDIYNAMEEVHYKGEENKLVVETEFGEKWLITKKYAKGNYVFNNNGKWLDITDEVFSRMGNQYIECQPKPSDKRYFAYQTEVVDKGYAIKTKDDYILKLNTEENAQQGDFVVAGCNEEKHLDKNNQWVVDWRRFTKMYEEYDASKLPKETKPNDNEKRFIEKYEQLKTDADKDEYKINYFLDLSSMCGLEGVMDKYKDCSKEFYNIYMEDFYLFVSGDKELYEQDEKSIFIKWFKKVKGE